jgi:hypothetical protein
MDDGSQLPAFASECHHARKGVQGVMPPFLQLHALAAARGDGLRSELRFSFERLAKAWEATSNAAVLDYHLANIIDYSPITMSG